MSASGLSRDSNLHHGEYYLDAAPTVTLSNGKSCTPQQFLAFEHSLNSVEELINKIKFSEDYPIFVSETDSGLFIQIGIIGRENYSRENGVRPKKIVYGRKWRIEANLPSSEIIQTIFLALKKAREHEIREFLSMLEPSCKKQSTPFNSHHDLPLLARNKSLISSHINNISDKINTKSINGMLKLLKFSQRPITLISIKKRKNQNFLIDLKVGTPPPERLNENEYNEYNNLNITLILKKNSLNELLHELMTELIKISDRFVDEHFIFDGFARFSRQNSIASIGQFSISTRNINDHRFDEFRRTKVKQHHYEIDLSRVPIVQSNKQKRRLSRLLEGSFPLEGFKPFCV